MSMTIAEAVQTYPDQSITKLSRQCGISAYVLSKHIKAVGKEILKINHCSLKLDIDLINDLYQEGMSTYRIADKFNCNDETIRKNIWNPRTLAEADKLRDQESLRDKLSIRSKQHWQKESYRDKVRTSTSTTEYRNKLREASKKNQQLTNWVQSAAGRLAISQRVKLEWEKPSFRAKQTVYFASRVYRISEASRVAMLEPTARQGWIEKLRISSANNMTKSGFISAPQRQLYYLLSASNITFYEDGEVTKVGPFYVVDCIIPKQQGMNKDLIIEVQGEYWHSLPRVAAKDKAKATYIKGHTDYDLLYLDELQLTSWPEVNAMLSKFGVNLKTISCAIPNLNIKKIDETIAKMFYQTFHYTSTIRKGATTFGVYMDDSLIACISYTYPIRSQIAGSIGKSLYEVMEISRAARATNVICPNLMSWLIGQTRTRLPERVNTIISYSDQGEGHLGTIYKASGFVNDHEVSSDYKYQSINGNYHKRTIWDMSKRMKMTEADYASKHNLIKIMGGPKSRWIYHLS
jgi:hypothetical protein